MSLGKKVFLIDALFASEGLKPSPVSLLRRKRASGRASTKRAGHMNGWDWGLVSPPTGLAIFS